MTKSNEKTLYSRNILEEKQDLLGPSHRIGIPSPFRIPSGPAVSLWSLVTSQKWCMGSVSRFATLIPVSLCYSTQILRSKGRTQSRSKVMGFLLRALIWQNLISLKAPQAVVSTGRVVLGGHRVKISMCLDQFLYTSKTQAYMPAWALAFHPGWLCNNGEGHFLVPFCFGLGQWGSVRGCVWDRSLGCRTLIAAWALGKRLVLWFKVHLCMYLYLQVCYIDISR